MGAHAQVGEDPVEPSFRMEEGVVMDETEVVVYKNETRILRGLAQGVRVTVEGHQAALGGEPGENLAAVSASAEGGIGIEPVRVEDERVDAGVQEYGIVVFGHRGPLLFREAFRDGNEFFV